MVKPRDRAAVQAAVDVLLKSSSAESRRCASATLAGLGIDEHTALAEAREASRPSGRPGPLRKDGAAHGGITVRAPMGNGTVLALDMTPAEAVSLVSAVQDEMSRRGVRWA